MAIAERVGSYRIVSPIAKGGMGRVYLGWDERHRHLMAIKVLPDDFLNDRKRSQYLAREVRVAKNLKHTNVIDIYGLHVQEGIGYLLMEFMDGGNLRQHLEGKDLCLHESLSLVLQICAGLHYIHHHRLENGRFHSIIHRDIKPENILLSKSGRLKIADFGLSVQEEFWTLRAPKWRAGTPLYMSPEQIRGKPLDIRTDIYSLGLVIYELLTGQLPYKADDKKEYMKMVVTKKAKPAPPSYLNKNVPRQFDMITMKALEHHPRRRYQTIAEMMLDLQRLPSVLRRLSSV